MASFASRPSRRCSAPAASDAFVTAFRIPNLLRDLFAEGALSAAFVATFTQHHERRGAAAAWRLANLTVNALVLVVTPLCVAGVVWAPAITHAIAPGFADSPGKMALTVELTRIMMPFLLLVALAALAMGILNTRNRFGVQALASAFFNRERLRQAGRRQEGTVALLGGRPGSRRKSSGQGGDSGAGLVAPTTS